MTIKSATTLRHAVARVIEPARAKSVKEAQRALASAVKEIAATGMDESMIKGAIRSEAIRQIAAQASGTSGDAPRAEFAQALDAADMLANAFAQDCGEALRPSPGLVAFLRRAGRRFGRGSLSGHADFDFALPSIRDDGGAFQIIDLTAASPDGWADRIFAALSNRPEDGLSAVFLAGDSESSEFSVLRSRIGVAYGMELVAALGPNAASGATSGESILAVFVGRKRFRAVDSLPKAAESVFTADSAMDFAGLEAEMAAARGKIAEFDRKERIDAGDAEASDALRQRPYKPLSAVSESFTMVPKALEGSFGKAMERLGKFFGGDGGIDAVAAEALDCTKEELGEMLIAEQVDALGMQLNAASRKRGFLLADQTGIGKGRSLAAMARAHLRKGADSKVLYFTESATVNVPDVCRDLVALGVWDEDSTLFLTTGSKVEVNGSMIKSPAPAKQNRILESGEWPEGIRVIVSTYSKFSGKAGKASSQWIKTAIDGNVMIIMDESHNALNPNSNMGRNIRNAIQRVPAANVVYASGTPARDPRGLDLYGPLLPNVAKEALEEIAAGIDSGGTVAQEVFASMLAEDGVMLRRDHDLGNIEFLVDLPDSERMEGYQRTMDLISPVVVAMLGTAVTIEETTKERRDAAAERIAARMCEERGVTQSTYIDREARSEANALEKNGSPIGGALVNFTRACMNAMKIEQTVDAAKAEWAAGRKPLITFHSTNGSLLQEIADSGAEQGSLSIKDQVRRIHERIYRVTRNGEKVDARAVDPAMARRSEETLALIESLPAGLSVSPLDTLLERLAEEGFKAGEISGRSLCYRGGAIVKRTRAERDRRGMINAFNGGDLDVLVYNSAGATGASYHASPDFKDQRGRSLIELETPLDIIKYVQSQGRGNRYGQVENPKVISVMTGLTPEMRILQQRNGKLRSLGASVDGNRAHPLLLDDLPDLLNRVGDEATQNVLMQNPSLARRLGFPEIANMERDAVTNTAGGEAPVIRKAKESLANKVLTRSIVLPAAEQDDMVQRIRMEFDVLIEELDSRNQNPLRPKELDGSVEVKAVDLFSGAAKKRADSSESAFLAPLYMSTAVHHQSRGAVSAEELVDMVERCVSLSGKDGFHPHGERLRQNIPSLLRPHLPEGYDMDAALRNPREIPGIFSMRHETLRKLAGVLERMRPGAMVRCNSPHDPEGVRDQVVVGLTPPANPLHEGIPSAYKVKLMVPGSSRPETASLAWLTRPDAEPVFHPGLADGMDQEYLREFDRMANLVRRLPVQVLSGNMLRAIGIARENKLGSVSLYSDMDGVVSRGIVVNAGQVDLTKLPVPVPSGRIAAGLARKAMKKDDDDLMVWGMLSRGESAKAGLSDFAKSDFIIDFWGSSDRASIRMEGLSRRTLPFFAANPNVYEGVFGEALPTDRKEIAEKIMSERLKLTRIEFDIGKGTESRRTFFGILDSLGTLPMRTSSGYRKRVNKLIAKLGDGVEAEERDLPLAA